MRLSPVRFGLAFGSTWGLGILVMTLIAMSQGQDALFFDLIAIYPGYGISLTGAVLGFLWGFVDGFFGGYVFAWLYNAFGMAGISTKCCGADRCMDCHACTDCGAAACDRCVTHHAKPKKKKATKKKATKK